MHDALGMHDRLDAFEGSAVQPLRFDDFVAFVEERRAVDGDLGSHLPRRVTERIDCLHSLQLLFPELEEGPAARRQDELRKGRVAAEGERLEERRMLAVHGNEVAPALVDGVYDEFAAATSDSLLARAIFKPSRAARKV